MRLPSFSLAIVSALLLCCCLRVQAQGDYNAQKLKLKPTRFDSLADLRFVARNYLGKTVELRGTVKGTFARGTNMAILFEVNQGETVIMEAAPDFQPNNAVRPGAVSRALCRVDATAGTDVVMTLLNATDASESSGLFKVEDADSVPTPPAGQTLPPPDDIMIGPDAPLNPVVSPKSLPSRGNRGQFSTVPPSTRTRTNTLNSVGLDGNQRAAFKQLAKRYNPRLADDMADYIAVAILSAAQVHRLDPRFLAAIVCVESSFDPYCLSSAGAMGLGQLMPFNLRPLGVANAWDPMQNLSGSAMMLRRNLDTYARQPNGTLLAVAAYHAGVGAVNRAGNQVPPRAATQKYVWKVYYAYRALAPELFR